MRFCCVCWIFNKTLLHFVGLCMISTRMNEMLIMWSEYSLPLERQIAYELSQNHRPLAASYTIYNSIQWTSMFIMLVCAWWFSILIKSSFILSVPLYLSSLICVLCFSRIATRIQSEWLFVNKTNNQAHLILPSFCFDDVLFIDSTKCHW